MDLEKATAIIQIIAGIGGFIGFIAWLTAIYLDIKSIKRSIANLRQAKHEIRELVGNHGIRLYLIEEKLGLEHHE
jgi:uncharacterized membrane protein